METILVAGGAGYIGSHMVYYLIDKGFDVVVADNLSTGFRESVHPKARFYQGDTRDKTFLRKLFVKEQIDAVIHMDAYSIVPESVENPLKYFDNNVIGVISLLEVMKEYGIKRIVFSTTAAVYGRSESKYILEDSSKNPINPYGDSKLMMERIMHWVDQSDGIKYVALRYFNAAGAHPNGQIGEAHSNETHLIPNILKVAADDSLMFHIYGNDYKTPDGTNVRDYIHILDLAEAHILALEYMKSGNPSTAFNLGSNQGYSVKEILDATREVTDKKIPTTISPRRSGDPDVLVADSKKAREILGWTPQYSDIKDIIRTAWNWHKNNPKGYIK
ncbi:UDP-glucose 4-epimerase GalE [Latilactobacillus fuchuensis]|uniref:UDP-glucose 4-epimerase n=1 Tax=Latilactobacillus fuchuensis TaxID=164393 RepID=A0A2N9DTV0_9LACO|nr:UDP-glucose 4-epimerase GalE [Latilactobacillus fuchuensis]SPC37034.1 UDP-glucose 4-epimerase [Latilactobacillus fuchuensis]